MRDLPMLIAQGESHYLEFKSALEGTAGAKRARDRKSIRDDIAEVVAAFANSDGGILLVGVEDDGQITGCDVPDDAERAMLTVPQQRLVPPQTAGGIEIHDGKKVLVFDVAPAAQPVMVTGDGFPRRIGDTVIQESEKTIDAIKARARGDSIEFDPVPGANLELLDTSLLDRAKRAAGMTAAEDIDYLQSRRLADRRGNEFVLRLGALLLFAKAQHSIPLPNCGVRVLRVRGSTRETGTRLNSSELGRIEGALPRVIEQTYELLDRHIQKSTRLHDLFFRETPEYPTFAWQEAIVNAVAHRDYRMQGRGVEVWMFDDRLEVRSPGALMPSVTLDALGRRELVHESRNPRMARVLSDLGLMREQGEGIPRMFEEMERSLLRLPEFDANEHGFTVTLRNQPIFKSSDPEWIRYVERLPIGDRQRRAMIAFQGQAFSSGDYQLLNRVDRDQAYRELRELVDLGLLTAPERSGRGAKYELPSAVPGGSSPPRSSVLERRMRTQGQLQNADYREVFGVDRSAAKADLRRLVALQILDRLGERRATKYVPGKEFARWLEAGANRPS